MPQPCRSRWRLALLLLPLVAGCAAAASAQTPDPIQYTVRFPAPHTHYAEIEAAIPTGGQASVELLMAVWTPGSYLVREYARHVETLRARTPDGAPLAVEKTQKNRWRVATGGAATVVVSYALYCREMTVRTNWVDAEFAMLNGAPTFLTLADGGPRPHDVRLELPDGWARSMTSLPGTPDGAPDSYRADDFDTLVDSPIVAGNPVVHEFTVAGTPHYLVNVGGDDVWDGPRSAKDVETLARQYLAFWGFLPYDRYVFLNLITEAGGGLEHRSSTTMMTSRWSTRSRSGYVGWLGLVAHEYFHAWNVKRLRPVELGPFDYEREVYTTGLWMAEGVTSYYADLLLARAGLTTRDEFLRSTSAVIRQVQTTPGRLVQPVDAASYDAWIKSYRPDENSINTSVSYYTKGQVIGLLLDARVRAATGGARSLDDVMRLAYERFAGDRGFSSDEMVATAGEVAGVDLTGWFATALSTTDELDYDELLQWFGLRFRPPQPRTDGNGPTPGWLGLGTRTVDGRLLVTQVRRDTPGHEAGVNVEDEILALDDYRVPPDGLNARLARYRAGDRISLLVARRDRLVQLEITLGAEPLDGWTLQIDPNATPVQAGRLSGWLD